LIDALMALADLGETAIRESNQTQRDASAARERMHKVFAEQIHPREVQFYSAERWFQLVRLSLGLAACLGAVFVFNEVQKPEYVPWFFTVVIALFSEKLKGAFNLRKPPGSGQPPPAPPSSES